MFTCLLVYLLTLTNTKIRRCTDICIYHTMYISYAYVRGQRADEVCGNGHRLYRHRPGIYTSSAHHPHLHTAKTSPLACHIVNDWGFLYATSSDDIYTGCPSHLSLATVHQFLSVRRSTPRDTRTERQHNTHCELYGGLIMLTSRTTTPPPLLAPSGYAGT